MDGEVEQPTLSTVQVHRFLVSAQSTTMMKLSLALLALLSASGEAFAPAGVSSRPSLVPLKAASHDNQQQQAKQFVASTLLGVGLWLNAGDVLPAMAATNAKTATPVEQVVKKPTPPPAVKKQPAAPVAPEKKALDMARAAFESANTKVFVATKEVSNAKAANDKASVLVKQCENAAVQAKSQYLNENDKLTKAKSNKNSNTNYVATEQQKVGMCYYDGCFALFHARADDIRMCAGRVTHSLCLSLSPADLKETERVSQLQLQNAKAAKKQAETRQNQAENNLKTATKQRDQAQKSAKEAEKKYDKYVKEKTKKEKEQQKKQKEQAKKDAAERALRLQQEETKIKQLQADRAKALQTQQEAAKQAAADQARIDAELKALAALKKAAK